MWNYFVRGGLLMYPLLLCSIFSLAIIIDRFWYYFILGKKTKKLVQKIENSLEHKAWADLIENCRNYSSPLGNVLLAGLAKFSEGKEVVEKTMEETGLLEVPHLEKFLPVLATIASISTLLGFTGTVTGMIRAFQAIAETGVSSPAVVGSGIAEALITTAAGLIIAIPTIIFYYYFTHRVDRFILEIEKYSYEILRRL